MESLQLAQMLADLSDLSAAVSDAKHKSALSSYSYPLQQDSQAAVALVTANKTIAQSSSQSDLPRQAEQRKHQRVTSQSNILSRTASPARFDMKGRRLLTPPISRTNSAQGSMPGTPREVSRDSPSMRRKALTAFCRNTQTMRSIVPAR
jgi:hypothetical protein